MSSPPAAERLFPLWVDRFSQINARTNRYSMPVCLIGRTVLALLHASDLVVYDGRQEAARLNGSSPRGRLAGS